MFRASSLTDADAEWIDGEVLSVLRGLVPGQWQRTPWVYLVAPIVESSVSIVGMANDSLAVRMNREDAARILGRMAWDGISDQELLDEFANTIVGHVKVALADGLTTGIPAKTHTEVAAGAYRAMFTLDRILVEVSARG